MPIPDLNDLVRVDGRTRLTREAARNSAFVIKTEPHEAAGDNYVLLTDHTEAAYLDSLSRLAKHRKGALLKVKDLGALHMDAAGDGSYSRSASGKGSRVYCHRTKEGIFPDLELLRKIEKGRKEG